MKALPTPINDHLIGHYRQCSMRRASKVINTPDHGDRLGMGSPEAKRHTIAIGNRAQA